MNRSVAPTPETDPSPTVKVTGRPNRMRVTDDAITSIRHMILTSELAPGDRLPPEADLAANLGLSRTSLREAVRALTVLGVIDTRQGDGSYITGLGPELLLGALGLAVDLNASVNGQYRESNQDPRLVRIMEKHGFTWGGRWPTAPDPMHFEWHGDGA